MKRNLWVMLLCFMAISALTGCQLAQKNADGTAEEDRLAGIFLTTEYLDLFDMEGYMNDHATDFQGGEIIIDGDSPDHQGRLYAAETTQALTHEDTGEPYEIGDFVFPVAGIPYFSAQVQHAETHENYFTSTSDPAITDGHVHYQIDDHGHTVTLSGTIYVSPSNILRTYYFNPVYQSADGRVYAVSGSGFMVGTQAYSEGNVYSQTMDATATVTENGEVKTYGISITLSISLMFPPEEIVVLQMDGESGIVSRAAYAPDAMPASIAADPETEYFIVETHKRDDMGQTKISRTIYGHDAEAIETFSVREDGILVKQWTRILWPES